MGLVTTHRTPVIACRYFILCYPVPKFKKKMLLRKERRTVLNLFKRLFCIIIYLRIVTYTHTLTHTRHPSPCYFVYFLCVSTRPYISPVPYTIFFYILTLFSDNSLFYLKCNKIFMVLGC